jgi:ABC-type transport system involved in multi-copper enzyme maturation permease subunit
MATRAIKPRRDDDPLAAAAWKDIAERAPSVVRPDQPGVSRYIALAGLMLATMGGAALFFAGIGRAYLISPGWGGFLLALGSCGLLFHAFTDTDLQYRRMYGAVGLLLVAAAAVLGVLPSGDPARIGGLFVYYGTPAALLGLAFLIAFTRNETDESYRRGAINLMGLVGTAAFLNGFARGAMFEEFMTGQGVVMLVLGLLYACAYIGLQETGSPRGYRAGLAVGAAGALMMLVGLGVPLVPQLLAGLGWAERPHETFFMPRGLLLLYLGLEYLLVGVGVCSDNKLVVMTRRELAAFFYSPIAYIVLIGVTVLGWYVFDQFLGALLDPDEPLQVEPVVVGFTAGYFQIFAVVFIVPLLTMRLLSEERRTGTLEVLMTAPVNEVPVVMSKFLAALRVFLLAWYPWALFLVALRLEGGQPFDYRPLLTFFLALMFMGAGWLAMGLFFSSVTRNQIAAAILTLVVMIGLTVLFFIRRSLPREMVGTPWYNFLEFISYVDLWISSSFGTLSPRQLLLHLSLAIFWLFLTVKVLESRKWA